MDDETLAYIRERVADEAGLPYGWADRLTGGTVTALREDATRLAQTLGVAEPERTPERDGAGRFAHSMNRAIREKAGRG